MPRWERNIFWMICFANCDQLTSVHKLLCSTCRNQHIAQYSITAILYCNKNKKFIWQLCLFTTCAHHDYMNSVFFYFSKQQPNFHQRSKMVWGNVEVERSDCHCVSLRLICCETSFLDTKSYFFMWMWMWHWSLELLRRPVVYCSHSTTILFVSNVTRKASKVWD